MKRVFMYGVSVEGENFTDRVHETKRLKMNFENGLNTVLISPRRMGKTSLIKKVQGSITNPKIKVVYMDVYDCRSEYDFYNKFAALILEETSSKMEQALENTKQFLLRVSPKISFSPDPTADFSISLGITPQSNTPEEILNLPEKIAQKHNTHIVVCIDEFQQIGEFPDTLAVQKRLRSVWQHQQNVSYCLFGSKKHLMANLFQSKRMPFYQFGEMMFLDKIPTEDWIKYISKQFESRGKHISPELALKICEAVDSYSSYVQQLSWNVFAETDKEVTEEILSTAIEELFAQCSALFMQQIESLTTFQMNFIRALCSGIHKGFGTQAITQMFNLGTKSNLTRIKTTLTEKEIIETINGEVYLADPVFELWFRKTYL